MGKKHPDAVKFIESLTKKSSRGADGALFEPGRHATVIAMSHDGRWRLAQSIRVDKTGPEAERLNAAIDGIEAMFLALAQNGILHEEVDGVQQAYADAVATVLARYDTPDHSIMVDWLGNERLNKGKKL